MAIDIKSPQFPESIFEGTLSSWLKKEGQEIKQDEVLAEIETDKVVIEVTAPSDDVMGKVLVDEGAIIKSSEVIGSYKESAIENDSKVVEETDVPEEQVELDKKAEEVKEVEATSFKKAVKSFQGSSKAKMVTIEWTTKGGEEFVKEQKLPFGRKKKLGR